MASGIARGRVRTATTTTVESRKQYTEKAKQYTENLMLQCYKAEIEIQPYPGLA